MTLSASHLLSLLPWALVVVLVLALWSVVSWVRRLFQAEARRPLLFAVIAWWLSRRQR